MWRSPGVRARYSSCFPYYSTLNAPPPEAVTGTFSWPAISPVTLTISKRVYGVALLLRRYIGLRLSVAPPIALEINHLGTMTVFQEIPFYMLSILSVVTAVLSIPVFEGISTYSSSIGMLVPGITQLEAIGPRQIDYINHVPSYLSIQAPRGKQTTLRNPATRRHVCRFQTFLIRLHI